jgi:Flp pilus assembly protein TadG
MRRRAFLRDDAGAAAIEFALVGNAFLLLLIGTIYLGIMYWHSANLTWAVESAARVAAVNSSATESDITTAVNDYLASVGMDSATVHYAVVNSNGVNVGEITASKTEEFVVPLLFTKDITYQASANVPQP